MREEGSFDILAVIGRWCIADSSSNLESQKMFLSLRLAEHLLLVHLEDSTLVLVRSYRQSTGVKIPSGHMYKVTRGKNKFVSFWPLILKCFVLLKKPIPNLK